MSAFFVPIISTVAQADSCDSLQLSPPENATVKKVIDGDTIYLDSDQRIRIIGIDTPEVAHHKQVEQAYAEDAKKALIELLEPYDNQVTLRYGKERFDRYGRSLAHVFLPSGTNVSRWLLDRGYAKTLVIPPNTLLADCYRESQQYAQALALNIWSEQENKLVNANQLPLIRKGYVRLKGKVRDISYYKKSTIIELDGYPNRHIELKITKKYSSFFKKANIEELRNKVINVSGVLKNKFNKRTIYLKHPSQIEEIQGKHTTPKKKSVVPTIKWSSDK